MLKKLLTFGVYLWVAGILLGTHAPLVSVAESYEPITREIFWVVAVLDGDTLLVSDQTRHVFQVRLLAVDTPEISGPDATEECYGYEATLFTTEFLKSRIVRLRADSLNADEDPYQRKLRYVESLQDDGTFASLNEALLEQGLAQFPPEYPVTNSKAFLQMEQQAKDFEKGLWEACE